MPRFEVGDDDFLLGGSPFRIIAGSLHYFRIHPGQWADRIERARRLGLNTVDLYVAWNFHSARRGEFRTDGWRDIGRFLDLVADAGLYALVRPGPYICAEWSNGGLPAWLTAQPGIRLRSTDATFIAALESYYASLLPLVAERQITRGGNVLMVQVENEYGAYGDDPAYLRALTAMIHSHEIDVPLFTCDQANDTMLARGGLPDLLRTGTFGSRSTERLATLRRHQPTGPLMCAEYWDGWFDSWGEPHHVTDPAASARDLDDLLTAGASVNLYMAHGGTNFGVNAGANDKGTYRPITTTYDYGAPLAEDGSPAPSYLAYKQVLARHTTVPPQNADPSPAAPEFTVALTRVDADPTIGTPPTFHASLATLDDLDPTATLVVYETDIEADDHVVRFNEVRDQAWATLDGQPLGTLRRTLHETTLTLPARSGRLRLLVEDQGRVNYGSRLGEPKGLIGPATTAVRTLRGWTTHVVDLDAVPAHAADARSRDPLDPAAPLGGPALVHGQFGAPAGTDLYLDTTGWTQGYVWVNGFLLGRYRSIGPTRTLYVPGPLVTDGVNDLVIWELSAAARATARFVSHLDLGSTEDQEAP